MKGKNRCRKKKRKLRLNKTLSFLLRSVFFKASYLSALWLATHIKDGLNGKWEGAKWPDLGFNLFPFPFTFINNPSRQHNPPKAHTLSPSFTHLTTIPLPSPLPFSLCAISTAPENLFERETQRRASQALFWLAVKRKTQRKAEQKTEKWQMERWWWSYLSVTSCLLRV